MILTLCLNPYVLYCSRASRLGAWRPPVYFRWVDVPVQDVPCEENHTLRGLLRPASLIEHRVRRGPPVSELHSFSRLRHILPGGCVAGISQF